MTPFDRLIEAVERGEWRASGDWDDTWLLILDAGLQQWHGKIFDAWHGSLDAAHALHKAVLPDEGWEVYRTARYPGMIPGSSAYPYKALVGWGTQHKGEADTPARAWLLAILRAMKERKGECDHQRARAVLQETGE